MGVSRCKENVKEIKQVRTLNNKAEQFNSTKVKQCSRVRLVIDQLGNKLNQSLKEMKAFMWHQTFYSNILKRKRNWRIIHPPCSLLPKNLAKNSCYCFKTVENYKMKNSSCHCRSINNTDFMLCFSADLIRFSYFLMISCTCMISEAEKTVLWQLWQRANDKCLGCGKSA